MKEGARMTIDEQITIFEHNAEYERTHGNLQGCLDFRQLVEWLKDYQILLGQIGLLEDIKAEIKHKANSCNIIIGEDEDTYEWGKHNAYVYALFIIDKYMKEGA